MIEKRYIDLMNRDIDGLISEEERVSLQTYLDTHPEARRYHDHLREIARMFADVKQVEPPESLREGIFRALAQRERKREEQAGREERSAGSFLSTLQLRLNARHAFVFAAGVAVGIFLFALCFKLFPGKPAWDLEELYGTFAEKSKPSPVQLTESVDLTFAAAAGSAVFQYTEERVFIVLHIEAGAPLDVVLQYDQGVTFEALKSSEACDHTLSVSHGIVRLSHMGDCSYLIILRNTTHSHPPIIIRLLSHGGMEFERRVAPGCKPASD